MIRIKSANSAACCLFSAWLALSGFVPAQPQISERLASAHEHFYNRRFKKAAQEYRKAIKADPHEPLAHYGLVRALIRLNKVDEAKASAQAATEIIPDSGLAWVGLADVHYRLAHFENAAALYQRALLRDGSQARAHLGLGEIMVSEGKGRTARAHFQRAFQLAPDDPDAIRAWARVLAQSEEELRMWNKYLSSARYEDPAKLDSIRGWLEMRKAVGGREVCQVEGGAEAVQPVPLSPLGSQLKSTLGGQDQIVGYTIPARLGQGDPFRLKIDTGATGLTLSRSVARKAGLETISKIVLYGIGGKGTRTAEYAWAQSLRVGSLVFRDCPVAVVSNESLGSDGLVGSDLFSDFLVALDFKAQQMRLARLPPPPESENAEDKRFYSLYRRDLPQASQQDGFVPVRRIGSHMLIKAVVNQKHAGHFLIDSGASHSSLSLRFAHEVGNPRRSALRLRGVSGKVNQVFQLTEALLDFGYLRQSHMGIISFDYDSMNEAFGVELSGIMGVTFLQHLTLTIDYRNFSVRLEQ